LKLQENNITGRYEHTYTAYIYVGLKDKNNNNIASIDEVKKICQDYVDNIGLCVTVTPTEFIYTNGNEPGVIVGLINYPRFPKKGFEIIKLANELGKKLMVQLEQCRISIVYPQSTIIFFNNDKIDSLENK